MKIKDKKNNHNTACLEDNDVVQAVLDASGLKIRTSNIDETENPDNVHFNQSQFVQLFKEAEKELYPGCKISNLSFIIKLMHIKVLNCSNNKSIDMLLKLLIKSFPQINIPKSHSETKVT